MGPTKSTSPSGATTLTPQSQLWNETTEPQQQKIAPLLRILKPRYQEDLCLGLVAYIRFKIYRPFSNPMMQYLYEQCLVALIHPNTQRYEKD